MPARFNYALGLLRRVKALPYHDGVFHVAALVGVNVVSFGRADVRFGLAAMFEDDECYEGRAARTVTEAIRRARTRHASIRLAGGRLRVAVAPEGRALALTARFSISARRPSVFTSTSAEALVLAEDAIEGGAAEEGVLLDWLVEHAGEVGRAVEMMRQEGVGR